MYRVHNHQNHVQEDEEMEEEDVEVDQENTETNSASGNVHIQICFLQQSVLDLYMYSMCTVESLFYESTYFCVSSVLYQIGRM